MSKPLIASGANVAFGPPCLVFSGIGVVVGEGGGEEVAVAVADTASLGSGVGEDFFFRFAEGDAEDFFFSDGLGEGDGEAFLAVDFFFL